jgi:O-antigen ligase
MLMATASRRTHVALLLGFIYCLVAILFTGERTAFMMIIMAFALITPVLALRIKKLRVYAAVFGTIIVMLLSVLLSTQSGVQETLLRTEEHLEDFSQSPYGQVFAAAIQIGRDHWLTGVGIEGLRELIPQPLAVVVDASSLKEHYMHAHNPYLEWFAEAGLVGLILFMCLVGILMREALQLLRHTRGIASIVPAFMLGACLFNFFPVMSTQSYFSNWTGMMVWYALAIVFSTRNLLAANGTYSSKGIHP